jgi:hypothetical protein
MSCYSVYNDTVIDLLVSSNPKNSMDQRGIYIESSPNQRTKISGLQERLIKNETHFEQTLLEAFAERKVVAQRLPSIRK